MSQPKNADALAITSLQFNRWAISDIAYSTDKNHTVEAIKAVALLLGKILLTAGLKYSLSPKYTFCISLV